MNNKKAREGLKEFLRSLVNLSIGDVYQKAYLYDKLEDYFKSLDCDDDSTQQLQVVTAGENPPPLHYTGRQLADGRYQWTVFLPQAERKPLTQEDSLKCQGPHWAPL